MRKKERPFIYLDHNATTPLDPAAQKAMMPYIQEEFGNPSSAHALGLRAKEGVDRARQEIAELLGCLDHEVIFTSGGSESNNMAIKGMVDFKNPERSHIITCAVEHPAILNPILSLGTMGVRASILPVDPFGRVDPDDVRGAIEPDTSLISIMLANNETGTIQPIEEISKIAMEHDIPFHTDAAQAVGKIPVNVHHLGVDLLSVAGHKLYGPKGIGALFVRKGRDITPLIHGAGQEGGKRAGTENTILSAGLGAACRIARERLALNLQEMKALRDRLQELLFNGIDDLVLNGHPHERLPNTLSVSVPGVDGGRILEGLPDILASTGAACHDKSVRLSHVLFAMSVKPEVGMGTLRLTVGRSNTMEQIEEAGRRIVDRVRKMRKTWRD